MITLTIDFTEDVRNLSLRITDIDKNTETECAPTGGSTKSSFTPGPHRHYASDGGFTVVWTRPTT